MLLGALATGLLALALWQGSVAVWGAREHMGAKRLQRRAGSAARAVVYLALGVSAARIALGGHASAAEHQERATAGVLGLPGGQVIVGIAGLTVLVVGASLAWRGLTKGFRENLDLGSMSADARRSALRLGQAGYVAKGVALVIVGVLVVLAAVTYDPDKSRGLDAALKTLAGQPYGQWLLSALALGFACYGAYCFLWSRHPRD